MPLVLCAATNFQSGLDALSATRTLAVGVRRAGARPVFGGRAQRSTGATLLMRSMDRSNETPVASA
jgi:hypothetical protein